MINWQQLWDLATRQAPMKVSIGGLVGFIIGYLLFHANEPCGYQTRIRYRDVYDLSSAYSVTEYVGDCLNSFGSTMGGLVGIVDPWMIACLGGLVVVIFLSALDN